MSLKKKTHFLISFLFCCSNHYFAVLYNKHRMSELCCGFALVGSSAPPSYLLAHFLLVGWGRECEGQKQENLRVKLRTVQ